MRIHPIALCLGLVSAAGLATVAQAQYDVTVLQGMPVAINASGQIVEYSYQGGPELTGALLWSPSGTTTVLQDPTGTLGSLYQDSLIRTGMPIGAFRWM